MDAEADSEAFCDSEPEAERLSDTDPDSETESESDALTLSLFDADTDSNADSEAVPDALAEALALVLSDSLAELLALMLSDADAHCDVESDEEPCALSAIDVLALSLSDTESESNVDAAPDSADKLSFLIFNDVSAEVKAASNSDPSKEYAPEADWDSNAKLVTTLCACVSNSCNGSCVSIANTTSLLPITFAPPIATPAAATPFIMRSTFFFSIEFTPLITIRFHLLPIIFRFSWYYCSMSSANNKVLLDYKPYRSHESHTDKIFYFV
jgi:hypothetical protein